MQTFHGSRDQWIAVHSNDLEVQSLISIPCALSSTCKGESVCVVCACVCLFIQYSISIIPEGCAQ